jgi:hypothetical protein
MSDDLAQQFEAFAHGATRPVAFQRYLLGLCQATPDSAWSVLALLDQYHRRGRISAEHCRDLRHRIQRQALGIEPLEPLEDDAAEVASVPDVAAPVPIATPAVVPVRCATADAAAADAAMEAPRATAVEAVSGSRRWLAGPQAMALAACLLGIAASPPVREMPRKTMAAPIQTASLQAEPSQPRQAAQPSVVSFSSDKYIVSPAQRMAELVVERADSAAGETGFRWWTEASGAKPQQDYVADRPRLARIAEGASSVKLLVPILDNPTRHHIEMFYVVIGRMSGGLQPAPIRRAAVFIIPPDSG